MSFLSGRFLLLTFCTVAAYFIAPKKVRWWVLLLASLWFYWAAAGKKAFLAALVTVAFTYFAALALERSAADKRKKKLTMSSAAVALVGLLVVFKLFKYAPEDSRWFFVPLGVSYYTFSLVGYLADIYYRKAAPERSFPKLLLNTLYYPKVMQGPISKFRELGPRLAQGHPFSYERLCLGLQLALWGCFKKYVIADRAALLVTQVFGNFSTYNAGGALLLLLTFLATVRHYCDFSGYMDIAIGVSQILGITLEENFRRPFFSKSAAEFWRRWHITLGVWFKDYVYMPLVIHPRLIKLSARVKNRFGKRAGKAVLSVVPLAVVWLLTGLWHGTGLDYVLWGCYWGAIIICSNVFAPELKKLTAFFKINVKARPWQLFQILRTFVIFQFGLLLSTLVGRAGLGRWFAQLFTNFRPGALLDGTLYTLGVPKANIVVLFPAILILFLGELCQERGPVREKIARLPGPGRWVLYAAGFLTVLLFGVYGAGYSTSGFAYAFF